MSVLTPSNASEMILYTSIPALVLIYSTGIFSISQFIKFIQCTAINFRNPFFQARHSKLNILYISSFLFVLYIIHPLTLILCNCNMDQTIPLFMNDTCNNIIYCFFFTRSWVFVFDRHFIDALKNWIWRREINAKESETNIFIKYRDILSTNRRLIMTMFYLLIITPIFIILLALSDSNIIHHIIYRIMYTIILIVLLCVTYYLIHTKMAIITDEHDVRKELLYCIQSSGIFYVLSHILYIIVYVSVNSQIAMFCEILILCIANSFVIYFSCYWTRKKFIFESISKLNTSHHKRHRSFLNIFFQKQHILFEDIMRRREGIESFCHHLANEFGLESILFLIEILQFKGKINRKYNSVTENIHLNKYMCDNEIFSVSNILKIDWMPMDPRMNTYSPYKIALYLYDKYIENSADLCINISSPNRREIYRQFKDLAIELSEEDHLESEKDIIITLYKLFDNAYIGIWHLIQTDTFIRFKSTQQFHRLIHVLYPKKAKQALIESQNQLIEPKNVKEKKNVNMETKTNGFTKIAVSSVSPTTNDIAIGNITDINFSIPFEEEKVPDIKHMRSNSLPATNETLFGIGNHMNENMNVQIHAHTVRQSYNPMIEGGLNGLNALNEQKELKFLNDVIVPADIIKTAADFWKNYINTLPPTETRELGVALYLSMIASDRTIQYIFKKNHNIKQKQIEVLSLKYLKMIGWLIKSIWNRNNKQLYNSLTKLGTLHSNLKIKIIHFNVMLNVLHETLKFYFPVKYRLQEQYAFDYIFSYSTQIMMNKPLSTKTKYKTYYKTLELKFNSERKLNENLRPKNAKGLLQSYSNNVPVRKTKQFNAPKNVPMLSNAPKSSSARNLKYNPEQPPLPLVEANSSSSRLSLSIKDSNKSNVKLKNAPSLSINLIND